MFIVNSDLTFILVLKLESLHGASLWLTLKSLCFYRHQYITNFTLPI